MNMLLKVGDDAPEFSSTDQTGKSHKLSDYKDKWLIIYFYPRDNTPGCTAEACSIRDNYQQLKKHASILGVSTDSIKSHQKFAQKHDLPFPLLSDEDRSIVTSYKVWNKKKFMGREFMGTHRVTYIINPKGIISQVYPKVKPKLHATELQKDLIQLTKSS